MKKIFFKRIFIFFVFAIIALIIWSFYIEPNLLVVKHYNVQNEKLRGLKVVFASDFHVKKNQEKRLIKVIKKINAQNADIILLGGDYVNGTDIENNLVFSENAKYFSGIKSRYGVFAVLGNHDSWYDADAVKKILENSNIKVLSNSGIVVNSPKTKIFIAGVEDLMTGDVNIKKALKNQISPTILLSHNPDVFPDVPNSVDITFAGHLHDGQVFIPFFGPLWVPSKYGNRYLSGEIIENSRRMIVSKGIGTSTINIRFNCLPEIVVVDFE